ncbi:MAG: CPBP family intramembrane metalloprotease [Chloroflexi bacterium]|nr:CPBP family intramembrane metalloprotease [Chloroflexota bacterium]
MIENPNPRPVIKPEPSIPSIPWTIRDVWIGVALLVLIEAVLVFVLLSFPKAKFTQNAGLAAVELFYLLPVATVFLWRHTGWKFIGFRKFTWESLALGCGLLIGGYAIVIVHNTLLIALGVNTQGETLVSIFNSLDAPGWFLFVGIILAPLVEEIFFRGFLFQGFREKMGWLKAALLSSLIFSASHLDPAALIPTFVLGFTFSYIFHRTNSLWPGMILHFTVNSFGLCVAFAVTQIPGVLP